MKFIPGPFICVHSRKVGPTFCLSVRYFLANEKKCRSLSDALFYNSLSAKKYRTYGTFSRNPRNRRVLDFVGKFFEFGHKYRTSGIFLRKVPNSLGKRQASTVRTLLFGGYISAKVPYIPYFLAVLRKKVPCVRYFLVPKKWPKSVLFLQIRLFPGKIAPSIAFFQFQRPRKNAKCPKNNRNCVPVFQSGSHISGATPFGSELISKSNSISKLIR